MAVRSEIAVALMLLAGCAGKPTELAVAPLRPVPVAKPEPPAPTPINAGLSPAATLWHLRAGLNVAALACRGPGEAVLIARYNALLAGHAVALKMAEAAYAGEYQAVGGDWRDRYDDAQTRLYNFFGQPRGRAGLCAAADRALAAIENADDGDLTRAAPAQLAMLDQPFTPPRLEVDARVFAAPARDMVASR